MFERFTDRARRTIAIAQEEARVLGHNFVGTEHILLALVLEGGGVAGRALSALGLDAEAVRIDIDAIVGGASPTDAEALRAIGIDLDEVLTAATEAFGSDRVSNAMRGRAPSGAGTPPLTPRTKKVIDLALREALTMRHNYIGTEHLLLAILREGRGVAAQILARRTEGLAAVRDAVLTTLESYGQASS